MKLQHKILLRLHRSLYLLPSRWHLTAMVWLVSPNKYLLLEFFSECMIWWVSYISYLPLHLQFFICQATTRLAADSVKFPDVLCFLVAFWNYWATFLRSLMKIRMLTKIRMLDALYEQYLARSAIMPASLYDLWFCNVNFVVFKVLLSLSYVITILLRQVQ